MYTLLVHGPFAGNCYQRLAQAIGARKDVGKIDRVVVSTYVTDEEKTREAFAELDFDLAVQFVLSKDVVNPGFYNINRQVQLVGAGLAEIDEQNIVIKLRNDQCVNFSKLQRLLGKFDFQATDRDRMVTTNCYTRADRLYHPSDMFVCGTHQLLTKYYALPYQRRTHLDCQMKAVAQNRRDASQRLDGAPEELLFRQLLGQLNWDFKEDEEDSLHAIRTHCHVANTWDVDLSWAKERTPYRGTQRTILPYYFRMAPFEGGPRERAICLPRHRIHQTRPTLRDLYFLSLTRIIWKLAKRRNPNRKKVRRRIQRLTHSIRKRLPISVTS